jgi:hypothetical protein
VSQSQRLHFSELPTRTWREDLVVVLVTLALLATRRGGGGGSRSSTALGSGATGSGVATSSVTTGGGSTLSCGALSVATLLLVGSSVGVSVGVASCRSRGLSGSATLGLSALGVTGLLAVCVKLVIEYTEEMGKHTGPLCACLSVGTCLSVASACLSVAGACLSVAGAGLSVASTGLSVASAGLSVTGLSISTRLSLLSIGTSLSLSSTGLALSLLSSSTVLALSLLSSSTSLSLSSCACLTLSTLSLLSSSTGLLSSGGTGLRSRVTSLGGGLGSGNAVSLKIKLTIAGTLLKSLSGGKGRLRSTGGLAGQSRTLALDTTSNTSLVADLRTNSLGAGSGGSHVSIDVGENVGATVLVDQVDVVGSSLTLDGHDLELVDDVLESTTSGEGGVGGLDVGLLAVGSIDDSLVVELINFGVIGDKSSLLEGGVVLDAGASVEEVGDHGGVGHPVGDGSGEVTGGGSLAVRTRSTGTSTSVHVLCSLLLRLAVALLLSGTTLLLLRSTALLLRGTALLLRLLVSAPVVVAAIAITIALLGKGSSKNCGRKKRGDENVLHGEYKDVGSTELNIKMLE